jgi:iron-sulfur cluster repair protein YtfE (RIC family)
MPDLIDELKQEHESCAKILNRLHVIGLNTEEGKGLLAQAKIHFLDHLKKEDDMLYPVLLNSAKKDSNLLRSIEGFSQNLEGITSYVKEFFSKYSDGGEGEEFDKDFGKLFTMLSTRIRREELILFKKYREIMGRKNPA